MTENNFEISDPIKNYFYGVSTNIQKLLEERELKNTSISKELVPKIKSARKKPERSYLIYYALSKSNFFSHFTSNQFPNYIENEIDETIRILVPIQVELGYAKIDLNETKTNKNFDYTLANFLSAQENKSYENLEKKFLDLLSSPKSEISNRLYSVLSILQGSSITQYISWPKLYLDVYNWENNRKIQNQWAKEFYKNLRSENEKL